MTARRWLVLAGVVLGSVAIVEASDAAAQFEMITSEEKRAAASAGAAHEKSGCSAEAVEGTRPKTAMFTSDKALDKLRAAYTVALERVIEIPACGELFAALDANGVEMLTTTLYTPTHPFDEQSLCQGAAAFTWVGGVHTRLCRRFSSLSEERAAMTLIHEALHHAGLTEKPMDRNGMSAREIDAMVEEACGRKSLQRELSARLER